MLQNDICTWGNRGEKAGQEIQYFVQWPEAMKNGLSFFFPFNDT